MNRYSITSYLEAVERIRRDGRLYDVEQIEPDVLRQLGLAAEQGLLVKSRESWPLRGGGGIERTMFALPS